VLEELLLRLFAAYASPNHPYRPEHHGYIVLIEEGDVSHALDLPELSADLRKCHGRVLQCTEISSMPSTSQQRVRYFILIPDAPWVSGNLRAVLEDLMP